MDHRIAVRLVLPSITDIRLTDHGLRGPEETHLTRAIQSISNCYPPDEAIGAVIDDITDGKRELKSVGAKVAVGDE